MSLFSNLNKDAAPSGTSGGGSSLFSNNTQKPATTTPAPTGGSGASGLFSNAGASSGGTQAPAGSGAQPAAGSGTQASGAGSQPTATSTQPKTGGLFSNAGTSSGTGTGTGGSGLFSGQSSTTPAGQSSTTQAGAPAGSTTSGQSSAFGGNSTFPGLAGSKGAQPAASNEPPTYTTLYEKYLKACQFSNQYLFDLIVDPKPALSADDFKKILSDKVIRDKLTLGLSFYKPKSSSTDQAFKEMAEGKLKWPGKLSVSTKAQEIVKRTSEKLNLDAYQTFSLFELYFEFNKPLLEKLSNVQPVSRSHELEIEILKLERTIASQYYKERISLLECIYQLIILGTSQNIPKFKEPIEKLISELIKGKPTFYKNLWESYKKTSELSVSSLSALVTEPQDREEWILQNLKEEFHILKIFYILFYELEECPGDFLLTMMDYFQKQSFLGSFIKHERQVTIKAIFLQRQEYATMIADLCVLILLNCLNLNGFELGLLLEDEEEDQPISKDKNPLQIVHQKGKEITEFFNRNKDNRILTPVIIAWTRLIKWYDTKIRDSNLKGPVSSLKVAPVDSEDYLSFMFEMKDRPLFVNANRIALSLYRNSMKSWVCLLAQGFEVESIFTYERLVDICCECLKEKQNLERFWTYEFRFRTSIAVLLFELLKMFPFREAKLIKLVTTLLGNKKHNYVANVLRLLRNLDSFSCKSTDLLTKDSNVLVSVQGERGTYVCKEGMKTTKYLTIPSGTRAKVIYEGGKDPKVYQFDFNYNFWNVLYKRWNGLLQQINSDKVEFSGADFKLIKLVCKIIIFDNSIIDILETDLISNEIKSEQAIHVPLLLLNTVYYFQRLPQIPQNIISHVFKALAALQAHPSQSMTLAALIQLYPRSLTTSSRLHDTSMMAMSRTLSRTSIMGYSKPVETGTHPILEVFNATKRFDKLIDRPEKSYDTYISLLKFAYELFVSNEFIFDQYPNEKYIKAYFGSNILNINKNIQKGTELLIQAQEEDENVRLEILADLKNFIKGQQNQSLLYSTFIDDLLNLIYKNILEGYEKMVFLPNLLDKKWKIGSYLLKITRVLLQRFLVGLDRVMIVSDNVSENPLLINVINHLNNSKVSEFILKTLEVVIKPDIIKNNKFGESFNPLGIENKYWVTYILTQNNNSDKQARSLREMIANCLSCLETIVNLIEVYTENRSMSENNQSLLYQTYVSKLNVVDTFEKLLVKKELLHFYVNNDMTQSIKINIILALFSYINFDANKSLNTRSSVDPQIEKFFLNPTLLRNSMISEEEVGELETIFANLDPTLTKNITLKAQLKNNQQVSSVSALAIRILTKLSIVWEEQIPQRKPLLYEYITMISHPDAQFTSNNIIKTIVRELLCIFANYEAQYEDACALLEMMIVCLHSQKNFVDLFLKNTSNYSLYQQDSFLNFVKNFFASNVEQYKPLLTKLIIFLSEVFQRESRYSSFVQAIRKDTKLINGIFIAVFKNFTPNYSLAYKISDYCNLNSQDLKVTGVKDLTFQLEKLTVETLVAQECAGLLAVIVAVRFLTQELISSGRKSQQEGMNISLCIKEFFSKFFMIWLERFKQKGIAKFAEERAFQDFLDELRNPEHRIPREVAYEGQGSLHKSYMSRSMMHNTSYMSGATIRGQEQNKGIVTVGEFKRYQRRKQKQQEQVMELEKEGSTGDKLDSILLKGIYKILDINLYGYGKNFLYDTQEFYFAMMNGGYKKDFVYYSVLFLTKQNLLDSLITLEHKYFESIITLFKFTSTLGLKGQSFSSSFYQFSAIQGDLYVQSLEDVFENEKEKALANANYKISFPMGFPDFFTKAGTSDALDKKVSSSAEFLERVIRLIWEGLKQDARDFEVNLPSLKALEQKTNFLAFAFNALFYLIKVSQTLLGGLENKSFKAADSNKMEKEKEKKLPLVLEVTNLSEIFKEIFIELSDVIWSRVTNISSEFTVDMAPYIILSMSFLECVKELSDHVRVDTREIKNHLSLLELSVEENTTYLSLVITYLELLYTLDEGEFLEYSAYTQDRLLKFLIRKISEEDANDLECVFIIKFFVRMAKDINGALHLRDNNILWELCSNKKLKECHHTSEYRNGQRNPTHILWCWVLILMRQMVETLHQESGFMNSALAFIKEYSARINYVLSLPAQVFAQDSLDASKREGYLSSVQQKPPSFKFTAAYFEELECISSLLFEYFQHAEEWVIINRLQFELILYNITHSALKMFRPLSSIIGASTTITPFEKVLEQIQCTEKKGGEPTVTNLREITGSPFKGPARKSFLSTDNIDSRKDPGYTYENYNPSVFGYKIEVSLLNSLTCLLYSLKSGLQYSELYCYFDDAAEMSTSDEKRIGIKYERAYWDNFALTLEDISNYLGSNFQKWSSNASTVDKISKKYDYLNNSVTCTIQNYSLNTNFQSLGLEELKDLSKTALSITALNMFLHFSMFREFKGPDASFIGGHIAANKERLSRLITKANGVITKSGPSISAASGEPDSRPNLGGFMNIILEELK